MEDAGGQRVVDIDQAAEVIAKSDRSLGSSDEMQLVGLISALDELIQTHLPRMQQSGESLLEHVYVVY